MPILKSAIKKLRQDKKRTKINAFRKKTLKKLVKEALLSKSSAKVTKAVSFVDKMAKVHLIHKNKAARLKSRLSRLVSKPSPTKRKKLAKIASSSL